MSPESRREILAFLILGASALVFFSLRSYSHQDDFLLGEEVTNACGPVGAFVAHQLHAWVGRWGAYLLDAALAGWGAALLCRKPLPGVGWKMIGLAIVIVTFASLEVAITGPGEYPPGGYFGQFFYTLLLSRLSTLGSYLILGFALVVAVLISTEGQLYPTIVRAGKAAATGRHWRVAGGVAGEVARRGARTAGRIRSIKLPRVKLRWPESAEEAEAEESESASRKTTTAQATQKHGKAKTQSPPPDAAETGREEVEDDTEADDDEYEYEYEYVDVDEDEAIADGDEDVEYEYVEDDADDNESDEVEADAAVVTEPGSPDASARRGKEAPELPARGAAGKEEEERKIDDSSPFELKITSSEPSRPTKPVAARKKGKYTLPSTSLLAPPELEIDPMDKSLVQETAAKIEETLKHFKIEARVVEVQRGPVITQYEISLAAGIKVHKIVSLSDDLSMALKAESIRIVAPIPGKSTVGVEVPNRNRVTVGLRELMEAPEFKNKKAKLPLALGKDIAGRPIIGDLGDMPHLLIAGSTGSGKSVCINSIIVNLMLSKTPDEVKLILIDPKMVELAPYEEIPHLLTPVVTDMKKAPAVLNWLVEKMEERYELLAMAGVRHLTAYNALGRKALHDKLEDKLGRENLDTVPDFLPHFIVIIDELADLMMSASKEVEGSITRLSQKSRAVGIHVILATQRPSVDVITGLIKANMPSRVSFQVASKVDSRTILDRNGSEKLLGKGDMLYLPPGTSNLVRAQGTFISDNEINGVVEFVRKEAEPQFDDELSRFGLEGAGDGSNEDELYDDAVRIVLESRRGSVTLLQRQLQIGYTRASRLMELMHANGLVGPFKGSKAREVYYTLDEWESARNKTKP